MISKLGLTCKPFELTSSCLFSESAHFGLADESEKQTIRPIVQERFDQLQSLSLIDFVGQWYQQDLFSISSKRMSSSQLERRYEQDKEGVLRALDTFSVLNQPYTLPVIQKLVFPMLYIVGEQDKTYVSLAQEVLSLCDGVRLEIVEEADHCVHVCQAGVFEECLGRYLVEGG